MPPGCAPGSAKGDGFLEQASLSIGNIRTVAAAGQRIGRSSTRRGRGRAVRSPRSSRDKARRLLAALRRPPAASPASSARINGGERPAGRHYAHRPSAVDLDAPRTGQMLPANRVVLGQSRCRTSRASGPGFGGCSAVLPRGFITWSWRWPAGIRRHQALDQLGGRGTTSASRLRQRVSEVGLTSAWVHTAPTSLAGAGTASRGEETGRDRADETSLVGG